MANPQIENGYTKISNELLEKICQLDISGNEMRILLYIIRKTYGYNCKSAEISLTDISLAVNVKRQNIWRSLKQLSKRNIIEIIPNEGTTPQKISIVKNYENWKQNKVENCDSSLYSKTITVIKNDYSSVIKNDYTHNIKENIKEKLKKVSGNEDVMYGAYKRVFLNSFNFEQLRKEYGRDIVVKYLNKVDAWACKNDKSFGECSNMVRKWLEQDGIKKLDFDIEEYEQFINKF